MMIGAVLIIRVYLQVLGFQLPHCVGRAATTRSKKPISAMNARLGGPHKLTYLVEFSIIPILFDHEFFSVQLCDFSDRSPVGLGVSRQVYVLKSRVPVQRH